MKISCKGQSMFELLVAISISSLILVGLISLATISVRNTTTSSDNSAANRFAQEAMEFIRSERDSAVDWDSFTTERSSDASAGVGYCFDTTPPLWTTKNTSCGTTDYINGTIYRRDINLKTRDVVGTADAIDITVMVSWDTAQGEKFASVSSTLTDWRK